MNKKIEDEVDAIVSCAHIACESEHLVWNLGRNYGYTHRPADVASSEEMYQALIRMGCSPKWFDVFKYGAQSVWKQKGDLMAKTKSIKQFVEDEISRGAAPAIKTSRVVHDLIESEDFCECGNLADSAEEGLCSACWANREADRIDHIYDQICGK